MFRNIKEQYSALIAAVHCNNVEKVKLLLHAAPGLEECCDINGKTPLHHTIGKDLALCECFSPTTFTAITNEGQTVIELALENSAMIKYFLQESYLPLFKAMPDAKFRWSKLNIDKLDLSNLDMEAQALIHQLYI
jgi:hypothetical protein